jgi:hypothetical protein
MCCPEARTTTTLCVVGGKERVVMGATVPVRLAKSPTPRRTAAGDAQRFDQTMAELEPGLKAQDRIA